MNKYRRYGRHFCSLLLVTLAVSLSSADPRRYIGIRTDPWIPNFAHPAVSPGVPNMTVADGLWSSGASWSLGRPPVDAETAVIFHDIVIADESAVADVVSIESGGSLRFSVNQNTALLVTTLQVLENGSLTIGSASGPVEPQVKAEVVFRDKPIDSARDPGAYGNGLVVHGRITVHGQEKTTFARTSVEPKAGNSTLSFGSTLLGWRPGDRLVIPETRTYFEQQAHRHETLTLSAAAGTNASLAAPLAFDHLGARDAEGPLRFTPHVANYTRNVIFRSQNPAGTRGHALFINRAAVDVRYATFFQMGRTTLATLNSTTFDAAGNPTRIGTNQIGRYPVHFHHLYGPVSPAANGHAYTFIGNAVDHGDAVNDFKWGITIHGSHYGLIQANAIYNVGGAGLMTEAGSESFNVIEGNIILRTHGRGGREDERSFSSPQDWGFEGASFWFGGFNNYVRNNVASGKVTYNYTFMPVADQGKYPLAPGIDPNDGPSVTFPIKGTAILEFSGNEAYAIGGGMTIWYLGASITDIDPNIGESVIRNHKSWNQVGFFAYPTNRLTFDGFIFRGDPAIPGGGLHAVSGGLTYGDYLTANSLIKNADIQNAQIGISLPVKFGGTNQTGTQEVPFVIENSRLVNWKNVVLYNMGAVTGGGESLSPSKIIIRNTRFELMNKPDNSDNARVHIGLYRHWGLTKINLVQKQSVIVEDYNGDPNDDFQVYYREQAPDVVVLKTGVTPSGETAIGSPEEGLTNFQNWNKYARVYNTTTRFFETVLRTSPDQSGLAIAGALAPCENTRARIDGLVCTTVNDTTPPAAPDSLTAVAESDSRVRLEWQAANDAESGIARYKIYRDNQLIAQVPSPSYIDTGLFEKTAYTYQVSAVNFAQLESARSASAVATTLADTVRPTIVSVSAAGNRNRVTVVFSERLDQASAEDAANYGISPSLAVQSAELNVNLKTVILTVASMTDGASYTLAVSNVKDRAVPPNAVANGTQASFTFLAGGTSNSTPLVGFPTKTISAVVGKSLLARGLVTDDGLPNPPGKLTFSWSVALAPNGASAFIEAPNGLETGVLFDQPGSYKLRFTADDGQFASFADLPVTVTLFGAANSPGGVFPDSVSYGSNPAFISFKTSQPGNVKLKILDRFGHPVRTLVDGETEAGDHTVSWDARNEAGKRLSSGTYLKTLESPDGNQKSKHIHVN